MNLTKKEKKKLTKQIQKLKQGEEIKLNFIEILGIDENNILLIEHTCIEELTKQELIQRIQKL